MTNEVVLSGLVVGVLAMLFFTPALMAMGISKLESDLTVGERILCCIPIFNIIRAEYKYYGKIKFVTIGTILLFIGIPLRVLVWRYAYNVVSFGTLSIIIFWAVIAIWMVCNMIFVYTVIHDADAMRGAKLYLASIAFPFGQYFIGAYLGNVVRHMQAKEDTFKR